MGLNKVGAGGGMSRHLEFRIFSLFDLSVSASRKNETKLPRQSSQCLNPFSWASEETDFTTTLPNFFPLSNDHHNKRNILRMGINFSCFHIIPFSPRNMLHDWEINKRVNLTSFIQLRQEIASELYYNQSLFLIPASSLLIPASSQNLALKTELGNQLPEKMPLTTHLS